ncbi:FIST N-terminal domain-containing protein [Actinoplanes sp. NPDC051475]|uniref:FIST signal transduction protein n=1 Tax=Actinoplanes sp. NPDC051475 TaxID=3157225 RepID=UPI00344D05EE
MTDMALASEARSGHSAATDTATAVRDVIDQLGDIDAAAVAFFAAPTHDGAAIAAQLAERFPGVPSIGCTTAGEFHQDALSDGGLSAVALPASVVRRAAATVAELNGDPKAGIRAGVGVLEEKLGSSLRDLDPERYVGLVLIDGTHAVEERVNEALGDAAPLLSFVGGTAADDLKFVETQVFSGTTMSTNGVALLVLELSVPYTIVKTSSFEPAGRTFAITKADNERRIVWEMDGRPAAEVFAEAIGAGIDELDFGRFAANPLGLMIDGSPWIRCAQEVVENNGLKFACEILEGMDVELMKHTDLVRDTTAALREAVDQVGGQASGAVLFNCVYRKLQIGAQQLEEQFITSLGTVPAAGFHTYGESWLGNMNYTLTGVVFGRSTSS